MTDVGYFGGRMRKLFTGTIIIFNFYVFPGLTWPESATATCHVLMNRGKNSNGSENVSWQMVLDKRGER